jgi:hypothetical protein
VAKSLAVSELTHGSRLVQIPSTPAINEETVKIDSAAVGRYPWPPDNNRNSPCELTAPCLFLTFLYRLSHNRQSFVATSQTTVS